ncbi:MAG: primosomal protein N' [Sinobacteraceae bacterium]|nr:primosomal protein N' [Nevskiaceae bacterium]
MPRCLNCRRAMSPNAPCWNGWRQRPTLTDAQATALTALETQTEGYAPLLLDGITGSGKTELYLRMAEHAVKAGRQVLALAPEIGLTPQLVERFAARFGSRVACYHSGMGEAARAQTWLGARAGHVDIIVGTRSAIFVPLARPGLIIVDEEHDSSYKQQDGLRYSARDLAVLRAHRHGIPVILGSATPSLESLHNVSCERYRHVRLSQRVNARPPPRIGLLDIRNLPLESGLSAPLLAATRRHLDAGGQALFFINRRGFSPVLVCHQCGWTAPCPDCDARLTFHRRAGRLVCHHCGHMEALPSACPSCGHAPLAPVGQGTERIEDALRRQFPGERVERIDSDRTRSASALEKLFAEVRSGAIRILVGTQILAKGHDFPGLTLAGLIDVDGALYGTDFRALEHMTQLVTQVAGRVGRGSQAGEVILQTHVPEHPQLQKLVRASYAATAQALLAERRDAGLPPFASLALVRAEAPENSTALKFLHQAREALGAGAGVDLLGPVPAVMERRAGRYRAQLLIRSDSRAGLQGCLARGMPRLRQLKTPGKLRWSLDVDPADLF